MLRRLALAAGVVLLAASSPQAAAPVLARIVIDGPINPAVATYLQESIGHAAAEHADALLVQLDTPGGLLDSTRVMVKDILGAPLPVIVYVAPSGAWAASAGMFITMAAHVAAMAPGTSIGAAHPVGAGGENIEGAVGEKVESFTAAFAESIAEQRGRNVRWAVDAVRESKSATAEEAVKAHVVDVVAPDVAALARAVDGRTVTVGDAKRRLALVGPGGAPPVVRDVPMRLALRVLDLIANPQVAVLLMMLGMVGLYVELTTPGVGVPGVAGIICLLLALMAFHVLSVNWGGVALLGVGMAMLVAELFLPSFGIIGVGGLAALALGALLLFDESRGDLRVARELIVTIVVAAGLLMLIVGSLAAGSLRRRAALGAEGMVGEHGIALEALAPGARGDVRVHGERWSALSRDAVAGGDAIEVVAVDGLCLHVRRADNRETAPAVQT